MIYQTQWEEEYKAWEKSKASDKDETEEAKLVQEEFEADQLNNYFEDDSKHTGHPIYG